MFKQKTISYFVVVSIHFKERIYENSTLFVISRHHFGKVNEQSVQGTSNFVKIFLTYTA